MTDELSNNETEGRKLFPEPFYRAKTIAQKLDMGVSTIFKYTSLGLFPKPMQLSTRLSVYKGEDLEVWVNEVAPKLAIQSRQPKHLQEKSYN